MRKTVLHIIDSLEKGGAEMLLVGVVKSLPEYNHIIIHFNPSNKFKNEIPDSVKTICLGTGSAPIQLLKAFKIKKIARENNVDIIHSHLYWPTIISRLAKTKKQKLISSYHNVFYDKKGAGYGLHYKLLDKYTYRKSFITLSVSNQVKKDLEDNIGISSNSETFYNYVEDKFYQNSKPRAEIINTVVRVISIGNLKPQKNYIPLAMEMAKNNNTNIQWDIYGEGPNRTELEDIITKNNLSNITLKGGKEDINEVIRNYDLFFFPSVWEGFGIALVEAMAAGLPCLVSDLPVFREVAEDSVMYYDRFNPTEALEMMKAIADKTIDPAKYQPKSAKRALLFQKSSYLNKLREYYG